MVIDMLDFLSKKLEQERIIALSTNDYSKYLQLNEVIKQRQTHYAYVDNVYFEAYLSGVLKELPSAVGA